ncbi:hypothetical protein H4R19_003973, partial [Coemansia spiralis]
ADHAGSSRFLSKFKHAFTGGRHGPGQQQPQSQQPQQQQRRRRDRQRGGKETRQRSSSDAGGSSRIGESLQPLQLDLDMGASLLTPESLHRRVQDESADEPDPTAADGRPTQPAATAAAALAAKDASGIAAQVANDSAYYLIDYINAQEVAGRGENGWQRRDSVATSFGRPAARRVVNKSTRMRQTQYDYNFGSQIFESMDAEFILLKTDVFKNVDLDLNLGPGTAGGEENMRGGTRAQQQAQAQQQRGRRPVPPSATAGRPRKPAGDVTAATAYTAAAINSIVAHNAKARSAVSHAAGGNARRQLLA